METGILEVLKSFASDDHKLIGFSMTLVVILCTALFRHAPVGYKFGAFLIAVTLVLALTSVVLFPNFIGYRSIDVASEADRSHSCIVLENGIVECWGNTQR